LVKDAFPWTEEALHQTVMLQCQNRSSRRVTMHDPHAGFKLHLDYADFPFLGLWANQGENYICLEPWQGMDDHEQQEPFENKVGLVELPPGNVDRRKATVTPEFTGP
jgi:galactose mutarotase-like enzyme